MEFHNTKMGQDFYNVHFPKAVKALERIAKVMEEKAKIEEKEIKEDKKLRVLEMRQLLKESREVESLDGNTTISLLTEVLAEIKKNSNGK